MHEAARALAIPATRGAATPAVAPELAVDALREADAAQRR